MGDGKGAIMSDETKTKVKDESNEHIYFTVTPRLVWAMCEDPDEYTLWCVVKDIAGESGECYLSRDDLATLAMISGGRVSQCRDRLISKKLLNGEFRRDPGYPQAVWHLSVPDFWEANTRWARRYPKIADRIGFKKEQAESIRAQKEASRGDGSKEASRGDGGISPNDGGGAPDDTKKKESENQLVEKVNTPSLIWEKIYQALGMNGHLTGNTKTYVEGVRPVSFVDNLLTLGVSSDTAREWMDSRLKRTIINTLPGLAMDDTRVQFVTVPA
jgi:hypothetical protein